MADPASKFTDEELKKVEKQLKSVYNQAYKDILQKQKDFNSKHLEKSKKYLEKVAKGEMTQDQYDSWLKGQVFQGDQWQAKKKQMLNVIYNSNKTATDILNGKTQDVFAFNATYANYDLEHGAGVNFGFGIYDTNTVINLIKNDPKLLPEWKIDQAKDYKWSQKKLNKQISLGILEGESLDKIATRLCNNLCTTNFNKMRTFARTAMTGAQNEGRLFSYENAKALGIKVKKQWMCTLDGHTRTEHRKLDGQIQDTDKPFEVDGLKIRYPGDPTAAAALVFNCRCTMVGDIEDYPATYDRYDNIDGRPIKQMTYEEWLDAKSKGLDILPVPLTFSHIEYYTMPKEILDLFGSKKMSNVYADIKNLNTTAGNKFYKELQGMGKPSEVWQQYLDGTLSAEQSKKIEAMLKDYADKAGLLSKPIDYTVQFAGKKMSNVYNEIKAVDTTTANQFYKELKALGKPPEIWQQYLDGTLDKDSADKITAIFEKYTAKMGTAPTVKTSAKSIKDLFTDDPLDLPDEVVLPVFNVAYAEGENWTTFWKKYKDGTLSPDMATKLDAILEKYAKDKGMDLSSLKAAAPKPTPKAAVKTIKNIKDIDNLDDAQETLKNIQEEINKTGADKVFKGIWKDDVTYADYEAKKGAIAAKKKYYEQGIETYKNLDPTKFSSQIAQYEKYLKDLEEFEKNGKAYSKLFKDLDDAKKKVADLSPKPSINATGKVFNSDLFEDSAKSAAHDFNNKNKADKFHRQYLDSIWDDLTDEEKYGIWEYTRNSNPMNKSLSGYHDGWRRSDFIGLDKTDWGHEDSWRSLPSAFKKYGKGGHVTYHKAITDTTKAIEKSSLPEGVKLVRGSDKGGFAGMIEGSAFSFGQAKKVLDGGNIKDIKAAFEGQVIQNHAFTSTGIASGTGFGGEVAYRIYAPKGTKAIYAEPQSYFGNTVGSNARLYQKGQSYSSVGGEAEVILQRGTEFRITNIEKSGGTLVVEMEVVAQPDYFKYGDEDTFNAGKTRHKK